MHECNLDRHYIVMNILCPSQNNYGIIGFIQIEKKNYLHFLCIWMNKPRTSQNYNHMVSRRIKNIVNNVKAVMFFEKCHPLICLVIQSQVSTNNVI